MAASGTAALNMAHPQQYAAFWDANVAGTRLADTNARLSGAGWTVIRIWEHEDPNLAARRLATVIRSR